MDVQTTQSMITQDDISLSEQEMDLSMRAHVRDQVDEQVNVQSDTSPEIDFKERPPIAKMLFQMLEAMQKERAAERRN